MSKKYYTVGEVAEILNIDKMNRSQVHKLLERIGIKPMIGNNKYKKYSVESIERAKELKNVKCKTNIHYKDIISICDIVENCTSRTGAVKRIYNIFKHYDCTANRFYTLMFFMNCCNSIIGLRNETRELVEEITGVLNKNPHEHENLYSIYNYYLNQAYVMDLLIELSEIELEPDIEFWDLNVINCFLEYMIKVENNNLPNSKRIDENYITDLLPSYDFQSQNNQLIRKLELLLNKLNDFYGDTNLEYEKCINIFAHAISLLTINVFAPTNQIN